ncbi:hypothetical protein ASPBRDRAFT_645363 [Aspergillus brasiliensis CBS 101740]|uniref:Uncharacterized protein n=1 Tax=Aspergillus brasiliensis (strain CBS 101740 / IMI 381727 / IBT 21946) TaxID=767769 RepID=A0A1L9UE57_ASPBC|nr:hypothetical protein ASPBRDRAFT_645363 [Aspergillus brasiliensis CBS 101740]
MMGDWQRGGKKRTERGEREDEEGKGRGGREGPSSLFLSLCVSSSLFLAFTHSLTHSLSYSICGSPSPPWGETKEDQDKRGVRVGPERQLTVWREQSREEQKEGWDECEVSSVDHRQTVRHGPNLGRGPREEEM